MVKTPDLPQTFPSGCGVPCRLYLPRLLYSSLSKGALLSFLVSLFQSHAVLAEDDSQQIYIFDIHSIELQVMIKDFDFAFCSLNEVIKPS